MNFNLAQYVYPGEIGAQRPTYGSLVTMTRAERLQLQEYFREVMYRVNNVHLDEIPVRARRFTRYIMETEPRHVLGSIRSLIMGTWNRDSSWVRYEETDLEEHDDCEENILELYGQVDYYIEIELRGLLFVLARLHRHPVEVQEDGVIIIKSAAVLRREAERRNRRRRCRQRPYDT